jgi:hypothetical protein
MNTILIIVLIIVLIVGFHKWMSRPVRHPFKNLDELEYFLKVLSVQCTVGSILIVKDKKTKRFIQFAKKDKENFRFVLPDARWSKKYFSNVAKAFKNRNIQNTIHSTGEDTSTSFLVNIPKIDKAVEIAKIAFHAMDIPPTGYFQAYIEGNFDEDYVKEFKKRVLRARKKARGNNQVSDPYS